MLKNIWINGLNGLTDDFFEVLFYPKTTNDENINSAIHDAWALSRIFNFREVDQDAETVTLQLFPFFENEESGSECDRKTLKIGLIDDIPIYLPQNRWLKLLVDFKKLPKNEKNKDNIPNEVFKNFGTVSGGSLCSNMRISGISNQQKAYIRRIYKDLQAKGLSLYCKIKVSKKFVVRLKKFSTIQDKAYDKGLKSIVGEKGLHAQLKRLLPKQSFFYEVVENLYMKGNPRFVFIGKNK